MRADAIGAILYPEICVVQEIDILKVMPVKPREARDSPVTPWFLSGEDWAPIPYPSKVDRTAVGRTYGYLFHHLQMASYIVLQKRKIKAKIVIVGFARFSLNE